MITTAIAKQKELSQYIKMYQGIIEFSLDKIGVEVIIKHNKEDSDQMFDVINDKLIQVCDAYLQQNNLGVDKFGLATIVMQLYTQAASECKEPYKVMVKETKNVLQGFLDKNKQKREVLERVKKENKQFDKKIEEQLKLQEEKKAQIESIVIPEVKEPVAPQKKEEPVVMSEVVEEAKAPAKKTRKKRVKDTYETAVDFTF